MGNWIGVVIFLNFSLPLLWGILYLFVKSKNLRALNILLFTSVFICSLYFAIAGNNEFDTRLMFFNEPITFSFSSTPNIIFMIVIIALGMKFTKDSSVSINEFFPRFHGVLLSISLSFGFMAFFSGQFMIRYIALEIVGLMAALAPLNSISDLRAYTRFGSIFLILRLGDIFLWTSILILQNHANTLNISQMIKTATELPVESSQWVLTGFLLAVMVKTAILPFGVWLQFAETDRQYMVNWLPGILMPSLGLYLLYRVLPLIQSQAIFINVLVLAILLSSLILIILDLAGWLKINRRILYLSLVTGMAIYLSAFTTTKILSTYLWFLLILRIPFFLNINLNARGVQIFNAASVSLVNTMLVLFFLQYQPVTGLIGWIALTGLIVLWYRLSNMKSQTRSIEGREYWLLNQFPDSFYKANAWFAQQVEINFINKVFPIFSQIFTQTANTIQRCLERGLENLWSCCVSGVVRISEATFNIIETGLEQLWEGSGKGMVKLSESTLVQIEDGGSKKALSLIQRMLNTLGEQDKREQLKSFRWDLIWIPICLVVILFFLLTS